MTPIDPTNSHITCWAERVKLACSARHIRETTPPDQKTFKILGMQSSSARLFGGLGCKALGQDMFRFFTTTATAALLCIGVAHANCDATFSTQRTTSSSVAVDEKKGIITINGEVHSIENILRKMDKGKQLSRHDFELLRKAHQKNSNDNTSSRLDCDGNYWLDLGMFGVWQFGDYLQNQYFWEMLFADALLAFSRDLEQLNLERLRCEDAFKSCKASETRWDTELAGTCQVIAGAVAVPVGATLAGGPVTVGAGLAATALVVGAWGACTTGRAMITTSMGSQCMLEYGRCLAKIR